MPFSCRRGTDAAPKDGAAVLGYGTNTPLIPVIPDWYGMLRLSAAADPEGERGQPEEEATGRHQRSHQAPRLECTSRARRRDTAGMGRLEDGCHGDRHGLAGSICNDGRVEVVGEGQLSSRVVDARLCPLQDRVSLFWSSQVSPQGGAGYRPVVRPKAEVGAAGQSAAPAAPRYDDLSLVHDNSS